MDSKKKLYAIGLLIALLLIIPNTRNTLVYQIAQTMTSNYLGYWTWPVKPKEITVPRNLDDALVLGAEKSVKEQSVDSYSRLTAQFRDEPALYANLLKYATLGGDKSILASASEMDKAIKAGKSLEPDNAYFDYFEAVLRFQQKRDAEGIAAVHRAAGKHQYQDHQTEEGLAIIKQSKEKWGFPLGWMNTVNQVVSAANVRLPQLQYFRKLAASVAPYETKAVKQGNVKDGTQMMMDLVKMGGMMRDQANFIIGALVGRAIQRQAVGGVYEGITGHTLDKDFPPEKRATGKSFSAFVGSIPSEATSALPRMQPVVTSAIGEAGWQSLSKNLERSGEYRRRSLVYVHRMDASWYWIVMMGFLIWFSFAGSLLVIALALAGTYAVVEGIIRIRGRQEVTGVGPEKLSVVLLAVVPLSVALMFVCCRTIAGFWVSMFENIKVIPTAPAAVVSILIVLGIAASRTKVLPDAPRFDTFLARMKSGSAYGMKVFLVLYVWAMLTNIPATAWSYHKLNQVIHSEAQMVWTVRGK